MWQSRRWRHLLNIIDQLPRNSAYGEALADDEGLAKMMLAVPERKGSPIRRMRDWSVPVELLSVIADRQAELIQAIAATRGAKPQQIRPQPRPSTALQRVQARKRRAQHQSLVARLLPGRAQEPDTATKNTKRNTTR